MIKNNSITIALILLSVLPGLAGTVLAESSEPFPDEEWNRTFKRKGIAPYLTFGIIFGDNGTVAQTNDGGYVTARGFQIVKFGGVRHEPLQSGIVPEKPIAIQPQTPRAVPPETTAGFEVFLAIMTLLIVITIRRNRR